MSDRKQRRKEKYGNMSPAKRFFHKYTGFIFVGIMMAFVVPYLYEETQKFEFFENWSCQRIASYVLLDNTFGQYPSRAELSEKQELRLSEIISECKLDKVDLFNMTTVSP